MVSGWDSVSPLSVLADHMTAKPDVDPLKVTCTACVVSLISSGIRMSFYDLLKP